MRTRAMGNEYPVAFLFFQGLSRHKGVAPFRMAVVICAEKWPEWQVAGSRTKKGHFLTPVTDPLAYLDSLKDAGIRPGLGPVRRLLGRLENPQQRYRSLLVGGTNGKGSIAATLASVLQAAGYRVGLYTSPHLVDFRERIRVDRVMIPEEILLRCIRQVRRANREGVTYFEFATALAFLHFARCRVDVAVLEVGMGGRLDATNVVRPELSVISNIAIDHAEFLGPRLEDIALEKAGIIGRGGVCVTAAEQPAVLNVLERVCRERKARLLRVGREIRIRAKRGGRFDFRSPGMEVRNLATALKGPHQRENIACALGALGVLRGRGFSIGDEALRRGLADVRWEGRLEIVAQNPAVLLDGAHNAAGAAALKRALGEIRYRRLILVMGILADKDWRGMIRRLAPLAHQVILTRPPEERALAPEALAAEAMRWSANVDVVGNPREAVRVALEMAGRDDLVCVAGSLYLVGAVRPLFISSKGSGSGGK
jgi:dihydrofolate synthase/folylpolyglutamate synthase